MKAHERASKLFEDAERLGCDTPTEAMVANAIHAAECDVWNDIIFTLKTGGKEFARAARAVENWRALQRSKEFEDR